MSATSSAGAIRALGLLQTLVASQTDASAIKLAPPRRHCLLSDPFPPGWSPKHKAVAVHLDAAILACCRSRVPGPGGAASVTTPTRRLHHPDSRQYMSAMRCQRPTSSHACQPPSISVGATSGARSDTKGPRPRRDSNSRHARSASTKTGSQAKRLAQPRVGAPATGARRI